MKYRKKPVEVEAWQWEGKWLDECKNVPQWILEAENSNIITVTPADPEEDSFMSIKKIGKTHIARPGDYIIKGVKGELYPCKPDIFEATYEAVEQC